jgi:protein gp37
MGETSIEWTDKTWNPVRGCSRVSPGCENCYAERTAARFAGAGQPFEGLVRIGRQGARWTGKMRLVSEKLLEPLRWRKPARVFVNSMSDLFHEALADDAIDQVIAVMLLSPQHTFQVLTKRAERMAAHLNDPALYDRVLAAANRIRDQRPDLFQVGISNPTTHPASWIWWGVSVEDQHRADERIPHLLRVPAAVRFLSCEPLLELVDLGLALRTVRNGKNASNVDWVIVGGESGHGARPFRLGWARSIIDQCRAASVPVFVKQMGSRPVGALFDGGFDGIERIPLRDRKGGDPDEWPEHLNVREFPR